MDKFCICALKTVCVNFARSRWTWSGSESDINFSCAIGREEGRNFRKNTYRLPWFCVLRVYEWISSRDCLNMLFSIIHLVNISCWSLFPLLTHDLLSRCSEQAPLEKRHKIHCCFCMIEFFTSTQRTWMFGNFKQACFLDIRFETHVARSTNIPEKKTRNTTPFSRKDDNFFVSLNLWVFPKDNPADNRTNATTRFFSWFCAKSEVQFFSETNFNFFPNNTEFQLVFLVARRWLVLSVYVCLWHVTQSVPPPCQEICWEVQIWPRFDFVRVFGLSTQCKSQKTAFLQQTRCAKFYTKTTQWVWTPVFLTTLLTRIGQLWWHSETETCMDDNK